MLHICYLIYRFKSWDGFRLFFYPPSNTEPLYCRSESESKQQILCNKYQSKINSNKNNFFEILNGLDKKLAVPKKLDKFQLNSSLQMLT